MEERFNESYLAFEKDARLFGLYGQYSYLEACYANKKVATVKKRNWENWRRRRESLKLRFDRVVIFSRWGHLDFNDACKKERDTLNVFSPACWYSWQSRFLKDKNHYIKFKIKGPDHNKIKAYRLFLKYGHLTWKKAVLNEPWIKHINQRTWTHWRYRTRTNDPSSPLVLLKKFVKLEKKGDKRMNENEVKHDTSEAIYRKEEKQAWYYNNQDKEEDGEGITIFDEDTGLPPFMDILKAFKVEVGKLRNKTIQLEEAYKIEMRSNKELEEAYRKEMLTMKEKVQEIDDLKAQMKDLLGV